MKIKAAVAYDGETDFRYEDVELAPPRADEVLIAIKGVGVCHTDLVIRSGEASFPYPFPAVFGHEGSGVVQAVGSDVTKVDVGDHVVMTFRSCGTCDRCGTADPSYCRTMPQLNFAGCRDDGSTALSNDAGGIASNFFGQSSFASHAMAYEANIVKVDRELPIELLGPLGCGIQTGAGAAMRSLDLPAGSSVLIAGGGSVGLSAVMGAAIRKCDTIILLEPMAERRALALSVGATHVLDPFASGGVTEELQTIIPHGADNAIDTSGNTAAQEMCLAHLATLGTLGLVGASPAGAPVPGIANSVLMAGHSIRGIVEGDSDPDAFIPELLEHFKAGRLPFDKLIKTYKLSEINEAVAAQHAGECVKAVLLPDPA
ncbi:MAG: NAD(P)-dependent alcohol dehydrogenase [Hyphomonadaceae bacterium]